ncbi:MAG: NADAR domain-containing protein [Pelodictyon phaeoclathratiforme]
MSFSSRGYSESQIRSYDRATSVVFLKTHDPFGGLSNMAGGFSLCVNGFRILTSEALYQVCRFPHLPEVQRLIIEQKSPMTAKMKSKPYRRNSRQDWDNVRVKVMRWCLRVKLAQNWQEFSKLLLETGDRPIVEESRKDDFWGAKPIDDHTLVGMNVLGRLLMELREAVKSESREVFMHLKPLAIPDFLLFGKLIGEVGLKEADHNSTIAPISASVSQSDTTVIPLTQLTFFDAIEANEAFAIALPEPSLPSQEDKFFVADLKPYPAYRDSGLSWFGKVPEHWDLVRIKTVLRESDSRSTDGTGLLLSLTRNRGLIPHREMTDKQHSAKTLIGYKCYKSGQIVMNRMQAWSGMFGSGAVCGLVSPDYAVFDILGGHIEKFILERLKTQDLVGQFALESKGIGSGFNRLYTDRFGSIPISLPPPDEQTAIVRFLGWSNGQLEKAIWAKRKVIRLLYEQKQAIIHRTVTRGLNPSVPLKPSGIPWLGHIPEHWEVRPIKHWTKINARTLGDATASNFQFRYIDISTVKTGYLIREPEVMRFDKAPSRARRVLNSGDTIVSTVRTYLKSIWFVDKNAEDMIASTGFAVFTPSNEVEPEYLYYVLSDTSYVDQVTANSVGIAYPAIAETLLARFPVAISPSRHEQRDIISAIKDQSAPITTAISRFEREIELLREYRTRLVADVVTGKLDVRDVAVRLPDEIKESELYDEDKSLIEGDEEYGDHLESIAEEHDV